MTPILALQDERNGRSANTISVGKFLMRRASSLAANLAHFFNREFCPRYLGTFEATSQSCDKGMFRVISGQSPVQVRQPIISLKAIAMVDLLIGSRLSEKSNRHQPVNGNPAVILPAPTGKADLGIAIPFDEGLQDQARSGSSTCSDTPHPPETGHLIPAFPSNDGPPFFRFQGQGELCRMRKHRRDSFRCHAAGGPRLAAALIIARGAWG